MKILVLYHKQSDHGGMVEDYARDYKNSHGRSIELVSLETQAGAATATLYDITRYPAVLALTNDGALQNLWRHVLTCPNYRPFLRERRRGRAELS